MPCLTADQGVLLSLGTAARPAAIADLRTLKLCARKGSTGADLLSTTIKPNVPVLLPASTVVLTRALISGRCEAVIYDAPGLAGLRAQVPTRYRRPAQGRHAGPARHAAARRRPGEAPRPDVGAAGGAAGAGRRQPP